MRKVIGALALSLFAVTAKAETGVYALSDLDKMETCELGTVQEENAEMALSYQKTFGWWKVKDVVKMLHPDLISWHSSLAGLYELNAAALKGKVPFEKGQTFKSNFAEAIAFIAYANDTDKYSVDIKRLDCVGKDKVVITTHFTGLQVARDPKTGCITHTAPYMSLAGTEGIATNISFQFKEYQEPSAIVPNPNPVQRLIVSIDTHMDDMASVNVRKALAEKVKTQTPMAAGEYPGACKTREDFKTEFGVVTK